MTRSYLVGLRLVGKRVLVVGGGRLAARRVPGLLAAGAEVRIVAPTLDDTLSELAARGTVQWDRRGYRVEDLRDCWYALALTDSAGVNAQVVADADAARIFCVRGDRGSAGSAVTAAAATHDALTVGVLADGDPGRSAAVRDAVIEALCAGGLDPGPRRSPSPGR